MDTNIYKIIESCK